jgi:hypothetical protein
MTKYRVTIGNTSIEYAQENHQQAIDLAESNNVVVETINDPDPTVRLPDREVAMWRIRIVLTSMNLLDSVNQLLDVLPEPKKTAANIAWNYGNTIQINSSTVQYLQAGLTLTQDQVSDLFDHAEAINI